MSNILVDVMNSKATLHCRHSEDAITGKFPLYYAIESRIYNKNADGMKGNYWFTNELVFDLDFDEKHAPTVSDYEKAMNNAISKLYEILGTPRYVITNKTEFNQWQKDFYFKKDGNYNLPKQFGAQLIYELKDSIQSQFLERVNLYHKVRLEITKLIGGDLNFKGHMHKNQHNRQIFNVKENKNFTTVDIKAVALSLNIYGDKTSDIVDRIYKLQPNTRLNDCYVPKIFKDYGNDVAKWYSELNSYKSAKLSALSRYQISNGFEKSQSRNVTLFNYCRALSKHALEELQYNELVNLNIFNECDITEPISEEEFNSTKKSVLSYNQDRIYDGIEDFDSIDLRVFKIGSKKVNMTWFDTNKFKSIVNSNSTEAVYKIPFRNSEKEIVIEVNKFKNSSELLSNYFMLYGIFDILENIRSLFIPENITFINGLLSSKLCTNYGLYDVKNVIQQALFISHFKMLNALKESRATKYKKKLTIREKLVEMLASIETEDDVKNISSNSNYSNLLQYVSDVTSNYKKITLTTYTDEFKIRRTYASILSKVMIAFKELLKLKNRINKKTEDKINFMNFIKEKTEKGLKFDIFSSQIEGSLINNFIIIKNKYIILLNTIYIIDKGKAKKTTINNTDSITNILYKYSVLYKLYNILLQ